MAGVNPVRPATKNKDGQNGLKSQGRSSIASHGM
jgi:hypothetical protein